MVKIRVDATHNPSGTQSESEITLNGIPSRGCFRYLSECKTSGLILRSGVEGIVRRISLSYWPVTAAAVIAIALHVIWFMNSPPAQRGEVITGSGAALIVLGLWVAARPFVRSGIEAATGQAMPPVRGVFPVAAKESHEYHARREAQRPQIRRDVVAERVIAVVIIALGTLLNGYGTPIVRLFGGAN